jgi:hypothetical protein
MLGQECEDLVVRENTAPDLPADQSMHTGVSELVALAKQDFEEKRRKGCFALTNAILKIDPRNDDAKAIQALVQTSLQNDIKQAYAFIRDARIRNDLDAYQRARQLLDNVLDVDPSIEDAKILLSRLGLVLRNDTAASSDSPGTPVTHRDASPGKSPDVSAARRVAPVKPQSAVPTDIPTESLKQGELPHRRVFTAILIASMVWLGVVIALVLAWKLDWREQSKVVSAAKNYAIHAADSSPSGETPVDEHARPLPDPQDGGAAPIASPNPKTSDLGGADVGQENVGSIRDDIVTNSTATSLGRIHLLILPSYAQMQIDGGPAASLPPYLDLQAGQHQLTFTASGFDPQTISVVVPAGGRRNVSAVLEPTSPPVLKLSSKSPTS